MPGRHCTGEDQDPGEERDARHRAHRDPDVADQFADRGQRVAHANRRDVGEVAGHRPLDLVFLLGRDLDRGDLSLGRRLQDPRREDQDEVDRHPRPVDHPQVGDGHLDVPPEHIDGHGVAGADPEQAADVVVERDQRLAAVVGRPPLAGGQLGVFGRLAGPGQPPVAPEHPLDLGRNIQFAAGLAVHLRDASAQHGHAADLPNARDLADGLLEALGLARLDIEEIEVGRLFGQAVADLLGQVALDQRVGDEQGQAQPERHDDAPGPRARAVEVGQRQPQARVARPSGAPRQGHDPVGREPERGERAQRAGDEVEREPLVDRRNHGQTGQQQTEQSDARPGLGAHRRLVGCDQIAEQAGSRHRLGVPQRPEREHQGDQDPEGGGERERRREDRRDSLPAEAVADQGIDQEGRGGAERQADRDAQGGERQDLGQVDPEDEPAGGAEAFQGRDGRRLALEVAAHGVADPDPADQQRRQADQAEEHAEPLDETPGPGRRFGRAADLPAGLGKGLEDLGPERRGRFAGRHAQPVVGVVQGAGAQQAGLRQAVLGHHEAGAEHHLRADPVRLPLQDGPDLVAPLAHGDLGPEGVVAQVEPRHQGAVYRRAPQAVGLAERPVQRQRRVEHHLAVERKDVVDRAQLDQHGAALLAGRAHHGPHVGRDRDLGPLLQPRQLVRPGGAVHHPEIEVAAQQTLALGRQAAEHRLRQRADAGDRGHAEGEAAEEHAEALEPAAQLPPRQGQRQPELAHQLALAVGTAPCARASSRIWPSTRRIWRRQRCARFGS